MTVGANSYCAVADVAALTSVYTSSGSYGTTTKPTTTQVEGFIDQVSGMVNVALAAQGFAIPVTDADALLALKGLVVGLAADLCHAANATGRFFTERALTAGVSPLIAIRKEIYEWVEINAGGLEALGAARTTDTQTANIGYRDTNESGDETFPVFQRDGFGNTFTNWDDA